MTETEILVASSLSMFVISIAVAATLFFANAGPIWIVFGGTAAGILVYIACWALTARQIPALMEDQENE